MGYKLLFFTLAICISFQAQAQTHKTYYAFTSDGKRISLSEEDFACLNARKNLEEIFSKKADHFNQPFHEIRDAVQAYKDLDCVLSAGFLFTEPKQVELFFKYKSLGVKRLPSSLN
jgi:Skp family chaperone for outer membrane proteins